VGGLAETCIAVETEMGRWGDVDNLITWDKDGSSLYGASCGSKLSDLYGGTI
jgi:hypothetical protein